MILSRPPLYKAFSRVVMDEKSLSPFFPVGRGAVVTNDWCITSAELPILQYICAQMMVWKIIYNFFFHIREILSHSQESGSISWRLPDHVGGITCIYFDYVKSYLSYLSSFIRSVVNQKRKHPGTSVNKLWLTKLYKKKTESGI